MSNIVKLEVCLDLGKEEDLTAYTYLKSQSPSQRKSQIIHLIAKAAKTTDAKISFCLKCFSLLVSVLLVALSVHFTYVFNSLVLQTFWAFLLSLSLVLFTSTALTLATYTSGLTYHLLRVLWFIGVSYSIFTAFAGQYNEFRSYTAAEVSTDYTSVLSQLQTQESTLLSELDELHSSQKPYADLIADLSSSPEKKVDYPQTWKDANNRFDALQAKIDAKSSELDSIRSKQLEYLDSSSTVSNKTVYSWLSSLFHLPADLIEFLILVLPSCFIDLASSLLLKFALGKTNPNPFPVESRK